MPTQKLDFVEPNMESAHEFIGRRGERGFYVPPYQRPFTWDGEKVDRFFESIALGMDRMEKGGDGVAFIGTAICLDSADGKLITPRVAPAHRPTEVYHIIDGQQRLTLLIAISLALHNFIRLNAGAVQDRELVALCKKVKKRLAGMFECDPFQNGVRYPRMLRCFEDKWSASGNQYRSPLGGLCAHYSEFHRFNKSTVAYAPKYPGVSSEDDVAKKSRAAFIRADKRIRGIVDDLSNGKFVTGTSDVSPWWAKRPGLKRILFSDIQNGDFPLSDLPVARVVAFARHVLDKVKFVTLVTTSEEHALDIFQSLNTTGDPLTAIETFKPEVIGAEKWDQFPDSESKRHLDSVDALCGKGAVTTRQKSSSDLVISFALAENGEKVSTALNEQRKYLRRQYKKAASIDKKQSFTRHLMHSSEVMSMWDRKGDPLYSPSPGPLADAWGEARFCLDFLKEAKHTISRPLITRFHEVVRVSPNNREEMRELFDVIKASAAFFALWRGSRLDTDGIDSRYRLMMKDGVSDIIGVRAFARQCRSRGARISAQQVRSAFCHFLRKGGNSRKKIESQNDWVDSIADTPLYGKATAVARFLVLVATHDAVAQRNGMLIRGNRGVQSLIAADSWHRPNYETVEHIVPQSRYEDEDLECNVSDLHVLGNLTLLPKVDNDILSNHSWAQRKPIYRVLSARSPAEAESLRPSIRFLSRERQDYVIQKACYLPMTEAVAKWREFTSLEHIEKRGRNLAELAWKRLAKDWLKWR